MKYAIGGMIAGALLALLLVLVSPGDIYGDNTTTTIEARPELIEPLACARIGVREGDLSTDTIMDSGYELSYEEGDWFLNDAFVGYSEMEDDPWVLCTLPDIIDDLLGE